VLVAMNKLIKGIEGQSLFEILIAIGIAALIIGSATTAIVISIRSEKNNVASQKAYAIAEDMLNNARSYSEADWSTLYNQTKGSGTQYYLEVTATSSTSTTLGITSGTSSTTFTSSSTEENIIYTTWFAIEDVQRNSNQAVVGGGGTNDPSTQKVTVHVSWPVGGDTREITLVQQLSNIKSNTAKSDNWSGSGGSASTVVKFGPDYFSKTNNIVVNATSIGL